MLMFIFTDPFFSMSRFMTRIVAAIRIPNMVISVKSLEMAKRAWASFPTGLPFITSGNRSSCLISFKTQKQREEI